MDEMQGTIPLIATPGMREFTDRVYAKTADPIYSRQDVNLVQFANGEYKPTIPHTVREENVYLFHSLYPNPNETYMQLFLAADALSRASPRNISLVLPYLPYLRQDRKDEPRSPISASLLAAMTELVPKVDRIVTIDMHAESEEGFYRRACVDHLRGWIVYAKHFKERFSGDFSDVIVVAPDAGGVKRARKFAGKLADSVPTYSIDKRRTGPNEAEMMHFVGDERNIAGKHIILYDDMIDSGQSTILATRKLRSLRPAAIYACATHGIFSPSKHGVPEERFRAEGIEVLITESIPRSPEYRHTHSDWLTILPLDELVARVIKETSKVGGSVSTLFD